MRICKTRGYFKQKLTEKMQYWPGPTPIIDLSFFENAIKSELRGVRG